MWATLVLDNWLDVSQTRVIVVGLTEDLGRMRVIVIGLSQPDHNMRSSSSAACSNHTTTSCCKLLHFVISNHGARDCGFTSRSAIAAAVSIAALLWAVELSTATVKNGISESQVVCFLLS